MEPKYKYYKHEELGHVFKATETPETWVEISKAEYDEYVAKLDKGKPHRYLEQFKDY